MVYSSDTIEFGHGYTDPTPTSAAVVSDIPTQTSRPSTSAAKSASTHSTSHIKPTATPEPPPILQIYSSNQDGVYLMGEGALSTTPFYQLCPGQDCVAACEDKARLYQAVPMGIEATMNTYGRRGSDGHLNMTLFGLCSNLQQTQTLATSQPDVAPFFRANQSEARIESIASDIAMCLAGTCELTRDPGLCAGPCSFESLISNDSLVDINPGVYTCINTLCPNTCGLPYADRDTFGVGILLSYFIQVGLLLICALFVIAVVQVQEKAFNPKSSLVAFKKPLKNFLAIQCFFGVTTAIAAIATIASRDINPLTGYVLIFVAIDGFLCPVFTLMLLHYCGIKFRYLTALTVISWAISSGVFLRLVSVLSHISFDESAMQSGLEELFQVSSCGGSSAMMLCQQMLGTNPLFYMTQFYNHEKVPSLETVPLLLAWSTVVLLGVVAVQCLPALGETSTKVWHNAARVIRIPEPVVKALPIILSSTLFMLSIAYYVDMVVVYQRMDLIDWRGWDFGQVVAFLLWLPTLIELGDAFLKIRRNRRQAHKFQQLADDEPDKMLGRYDSLNVAGTRNNSNVNK
ncbi:hypothetical protein BKA67DRAFT_81626 [Truncatella angustata]|uniref:Uncharacterized protein n=1 Tax=Truncatella angustata TaxID=152316 RepID=A0A9P8UZZ8_9PEZI|nr:uncharacterized protein BKA67DRAFT_81626 [Truncatella angustata]KAH6661312.1 hypothetical protein BKA67DRAFT_81626 [Truncatella angustata]